MVPRRRPPPSSPPALAVLLLASLLAAQGAKLGSRRADAPEGPGTLPGGLRGPADLHFEDKPPPYAVAMESWASLKVAVNRLGSELKQLLLVKNDVTMLQGDLTTQEDLWRKAEEDLQAEIASLESQASDLRQQVQKGAHIHEDVEKLKRSLQEERGLSADVRAAHEHEEAQAKLAEQLYRGRIMQLKLRKEEANRTAMAAIQEARDRELAAQEKAVQLERERSAKKDELTDRQQQFATQQDEEESKINALASQESSLNATWAHLSSRILPEIVVQGQLQSMRVTLERETQAIIMVQTAVVQLAAKCKQETEQVEAILLEEEAKADKMRKAKEPVCNRVKSQRDVLEQMVAQACGDNVTAAAVAVPGGGAPSPSAAPP